MNRQPNVGDIWTRQHAGRKATRKVSALFQYTDGLQMVRWYNPHKPTTKGKCSARRLMEEWELESEQPGS
jgi:hypothetical protein